MRFFSKTDKDYLKATLFSWWSAFGAVMGILRVLEKWFGIVLGLPHEALIALAFLCFSISQFKAYKKVHERLDEEIAKNNNEARQLNFGFRLYSKPEPHITMEMVSGHGDTIVPVPFIGVTVSNKCERHIEVVACHLSKARQSNYVRVPSDIVIRPMDSGDVDVTRSLIELVAELRKPDWDKIFGPYQVEIAVECRGEPGEKPTKSSVKIFDLEISPTRSAVPRIAIAISPHLA